MSMYVYVMCTHTTYIHVCVAMYVCTALCVLVTQLAAVTIIRVHMYYRYYYCYYS